MPIFSCFLSACKMKYLSQANDKVRLLFKVKYWAKGSTGSLSSLNGPVGETRVLVCSVFQYTESV